jgi:ABC-type sugar transport system ATPase subunit
MRTEIKRLRERVATTTIYVTHDQVEAMTLADRIVVLDRGHIQQIGTPEEIYETPATTFVAGFIGAPPMNLLPARVIGRGAIELPGGARLAVAPELAARSSGDVWCGVRPEHLAWAPADGSIVGPAVVVEPLGSDTMVSLDIGGHPLIARVPPKTVRRTGERVALAVDAANVHLFDQATERRL